MHLLFAWEQGSGYGHLGHIYPVARLAKARGHRVSLAARYLENVWAAGDVPFDLVLPAPNVRPTRFEQETRTFSDVVRQSGFAHPRALAACTRGWMGIFDILKPQLIICEHAFNAVFAARMAGIPAARLGTGFSVPAVAQPSPPMRIWQPHSEAECWAADEELLDVLQATARTLGGPDYSAVSDLFGYGEEFLVTWPELDHMGTQPGRFYYGPMEGLSGRARPDWPQGRTSGDPRVFMYLSEGHPEQMTVLQALRQLGWPTIFHARNKPDVEPGPHVLYCPQAVDVHTTLAQADVVISHGSHGICADAMRHGCSMFLLPDTFERSLIAIRMAQQGLARIPGRNGASLATILDDLRSLVESPLPNTGALQARYRSYDPAAAAAELTADLEDYVKSA